MPALTVHPNGNRTRILLSSVFGKLKRNHLSAKTISERRKPMKPSTKDQTKGKFHKVKGKIKEIAGKISMDHDLEAEGKAENVDGKIQEKIAEIKAVVGK